MKKYLVGWVLSLISFNAMALSEDEIKFCDAYAKAGTNYAIGRQIGMLMKIFVDSIHDENELDESLKELLSKLLVKAYLIPIEADKNTAKEVIINFHKEIYLDCLIREL